MRFFPAIIIFIQLWPRTTTFKHYLYMILKALRLRPLTTRTFFRFADEKGNEPSQTDAAAAALDNDVKAELKKKFTGEVRIEEKYHKKTSALYDRYMQVREKPIICHDGLQLAYQFIIQRLPIFTPFHQRTFEAQRNRYVYAKKTGFYLQLPKDLKLEQGDYPFKDYDEANEENRISHQITLSQTEKITYRENSKLWKYTDPNITDPHSIQTYSSNQVFLIVKEKGKWIFPTKVLNQKDNHTNIFNFMVNHLFQNTKYPVVHFPTKKPLGIKRTKIQGIQREVRVLTFHGISAYGIPKFPTNMFEDYAWVPKAHLADYFEDKYHEKSAWAVTQQF